MKVNIILRNGFLGAFLSVLPMFVTPYIGKFIGYKTHNVFLYMVIIVASVAFVIVAWIYVVGLIVPNFSGYSYNPHRPELKKIKSHEIMLARLLTVCVIAIAMTIVIDTGYYLKMLF